MDQQMQRGLVQLRVVPPGPLVVQQAVAETFGCPYPRFL